MLDLRFLRENPEVVKQNIRNKFQDSKLPLVDEVIELDAESRATQQEADALRASRNTLSKQIGALMGQGKKDEAEEVKKQVNIFYHLTLEYKLFGIKGGARLLVLFVIFSQWKSFKRSVCTYLL